MQLTAAQGAGVTHALSPKIAAIATKDLLWLATEAVCRARRSCLQRILACTDKLASLVPAPAAQQAEGSAASTDLAVSARRCLFVRILMLLLNLDAPAVLAAEKDEKHASLLQPYLSILRQMCVRPCVC